VIFPALARVGMLRAVGAGGVPGSDAATAHLAPSGLVVFPAPGATTAEVRLAGPTIESAVRDQVGIRSCRRHRRSGFSPWRHRSRAISDNNIGATETSTSVGILRGAHRYARGSTAVSACVIVGCRNR
jgi:hypothetical protein